MSIAVMSEVWKLDLNSTEKLILLAFADHANDEGVAYPSTDWIAHKSGVSRRHAVRVIKGLIDRGLIVVDDPGGGRGNRRVVHIHPEKGDALSPFRPRKKGDTMSLNSGERVTPCPLKGDTMSPEPSVEPSKGTSYESNDSGKPDVENSERWNNRLAPLARQLGGDGFVADILAWCRDMVGDTERAARILEGAHEMREDGRLSGWKEPGDPMWGKHLNAQHENSPPFSRQAEAYWIHRRKRKDPKPSSGGLTKPQVEVA